MNLKRLTDIIGTTAAISPRKGQIAYANIAEYLTRGEEVRVTFEGITDFSSAFCNSFIGKLYMDFEPELVDQLLLITGISPEAVWYKKIANARLLGTNENVRSERQRNLEGLIFS
jgi:hypothetical protein